jgi:hypothetical protein
MSDTRHLQTRRGFAPPVPKSASVEIDQLRTVAVAGTLIYGVLSRLWL